MVWAGVNVTQQLGFNQFNVALASFSGGCLHKAIAASGKWKRNYRRKQIKQGWFLLTNLSSLQAAITAYQQRSGIECMFKDCKSGGYNLEGCHACELGLSAIILLIAIAYTSAIIQGIDIWTSSVERYICRPKESRRIQRPHSNFWVGLYGKSWLNHLQLYIYWVGEWMRIHRNQQLSDQWGLKAIDQIQPAL